jgi:hypothetical protein
MIVCKKSLKIPKEYSETVLNIFLCLTFVVFFIYHVLLLILFVLFLVYISYTLKQANHNTAGATCGAGTAYPSVAPEFTLGF